MDQTMHHLIDEMAFADFDGLDDTVLQGIQLNLTEWLLAEGSLRIQGAEQRTSDYVLGPKGPLLTVRQRDWLQQLTQKPLRLYDVTEVVPGAQMTLCDALDTQVCAGPS